jgi:hypothetical protein
MSLAVQTTNTSLSWSFSHDRNVPNMRVVTPLSCAPPVPANAFSTSSMTQTQGARASIERSAWRVRSSDWPTRLPMRAPTSRITVGRPVS